MLDSNCALWSDPRIPSPLNHVGPVRTKTDTRLVRSARSRLRQTRWINSQNSRRVRRLASLPVSARETFLIHEGSKVGYRQRGQIRLCSQPRPGASVIHSFIHAASGCCSCRHSSGGSSAECLRCLFAPPATDKYLDRYPPAALSVPLRPSRGVMDAASGQERPP